VAYLGCGKHGSCHGRHYDGGAKIAWQTSDFVTCSSFNLYFEPHATINCTAGSIQRPSSAIIRACCASTKHCDKTVVLWHNTTIRHCHRTRTLPCNIYKTSSSDSSRYKKSFVSLFALMRFRQEYVSQIVIVTNLSQWLWESDCYANNCSWSSDRFTNYLKLLRPALTLRNSSTATSVRQTGKTLCC